MSNPKVEVRESFIETLVERIRELEAEKALLEAENADLRNQLKAALERC
jgi:cell division protein FtsB